MMYLPDTNIFIRALYGSHPEAEFLQKAIQDQKVAVSVVTIAEFYPKAEKDERIIFNQLIEILSVIPVDTQVAKIAGDYRGKYLRKSKKVFLLDCLLAAQAKVHQLILVTNNRQDFPMKDIKVILPRS